MFERLVLPTPFQVGPVNAYLAGRTVVDPGPDSEDALAALEEGLADRGLAIADVEQVLVTHPHPDHFGLAHHLREAGADVLAGPTAASVMGDFEGRLAYEQAYFSALFEAHGMAPETTSTVTQLPEAFVEFAPSVEVDRELTAGETVAIGGPGRTDEGGAATETGTIAEAETTAEAGTATATGTPADGFEVAVRELAGHSEEELAFEWEHDSDGFSAIVGDQVLPDTTPNPFLQPPPRAGNSTAAPDHDGLADLDDQRSHQLVAFDESLRGLRGIGHDRLLPGHGGAIADPAGRIDELLAANEERTAAVLELVEGPTTAVDVMRGLFPDLAVIDYFPGMSEALGHLDVLVERGEVIREEREKGGESELVYRPA